MPEYKIDLPPLTFSASSPTPPPDTEAQTIYIIRIAHLEPEWQFSGRVESPHFQQVAQRTGSQPSPAQQAHPRAPQKLLRSAMGNLLDHAVA